MYKNLKNPIVLFINVILIMSSIGNLFGWDKQFLTNVMYFTFSKGNGEYIGVITDHYRDEAGDPMLSSQWGNHFYLYDKYGNQLISYNVNPYILIDVVISGDANKIAFLLQKPFIDAEGNNGYTYCCRVIDRSQNIVWDDIYNGLGN